MGRDKAAGFIYCLSARPANYALPASYALPAKPRFPSRTPTRVAARPREIYRLSGPRAPMPVRTRPASRPHAIAPGIGAWGSPPLPAIRAARALRAALKATLEAGEPV
jgi:hypothetical protein